MPVTNLFEYIARGPGTSARHIRQPLTDRLIHVGTGRYIGDALLRRGVLNHDFRFAFNCQYNRLPGISSM